MVGCALFHGSYLWAYTVLLQGESTLLTEDFRDSPECEHLHAHLQLPLHGTFSHSLPE